MSAPNVRGQASADAAALALSADKRRNKLGYHRTSVACGHCRRRKIRCIPAPHDPQSRCSNCIRLKKECTFYPVDQQPQPDPRRGAKAQNGLRASESSSPATSTGQMSDLPSSLPYPPLNIPANQDLGGPQMKRHRTESFSPEIKGVKSLTSELNNYPPEKVSIVTSSRHFDYNQGTNWMASDASPGIKPQADVSQNFWRPNNQDSPITPAFSPFTPSLQIPPTQNWPSSHAEPSPREDLAWSVPQRSGSYSNIEGLQNHQQPYAAAPYSQAPSSSSVDHYTTKPRAHHPGMYPPPPVSGSSSAMLTPTSATHEQPPYPHPHSASLPPAAFSNWPQQQQQYSYTHPKPIGSTNEGYGGWNSGHEPLPRLTGYSGDGHALPPPHTYSYPEQQSGVYYQGHHGR